jgi:hypothetical protein
MTCLISPATLERSRIAYFAPVDMQQSVQLRNNGNYSALYFSANLREFSPRFGIFSWLLQINSR